MLLRNASAGISHHDLHLPALRITHGSDGNHASLWHSLDCIEKEIEEDLLELLRVGHHPGDVWREAQHDPHVLLSDFPFEQCTGPFYEPSNVYRGRGRAAGSGEGEKAPDRPIRLRHVAVDDL
jgi:hypothetical protein